MIMPYIEEQQTSADMISEFRGYNHNPVIGDNEFFDMENMTSDKYPMIGTRDKRGELEIGLKDDEEIVGAVGKDNMCVFYRTHVDSDMPYYVDYLTHERYGTMFFLKAPIELDSNMNLEDVPIHLHSVEDNYYGATSTYNDSLIYNYKEVAKPDSYLSPARFMTRDCFPHQVYTSAPRGLNIIQDGYAYYKTPTSAASLGTDYLFHLGKAKIRTKAVTPVMLTEEQFNAARATTAQTTITKDGTQYPVYKDAFSDGSILLGDKKYTSYAAYRSDMEAAGLTDAYKITVEITAGWKRADDPADTSTTHWLWEGNSSSIADSSSQIANHESYYDSNGELKSTIQNVDNMCVKSDGSIVVGEVTGWAGHVHKEFNIANPATGNHWIKGKSIYICTDGTSDFAIIGKKITVLGITETQYYTYESNGTRHLKYKFSDQYGDWITVPAYNSRADLEHRYECDIYISKSDAEQIITLGENQKALKNIGASDVVSLNDHYDYGQTNSAELNVFLAFGTKEETEYEATLGTYELNTGDFLKVCQYNPATRERSYDTTVCEYIDKEHDLIEMGANLIVLPEKYRVNTIKKDTSTQKFSEIESLEKTYEGNVTPSWNVTIGTESGTAPSPPEAYTTNVWWDTANNVAKKWSTTLKMWEVVPVYKTLTFDTTGFKKGDSIRFSGDDASYKIEDITYPSGGFSGTIRFQTDEKPTGTVAYSTIITRLMPKMDYVIECQNRLWGCRYGENNNGETVNEIFASKLGDPSNWWSFHNTADDSYYVNLGDKGEFTGAVKYQDYPVFFRADKIHRVTGSYPANYQVKNIDGYGVKPGCHKSLTVMNDIAYYLSPMGMVMFNGGIPVSLAENFGDVKYKDCISGDVGNKLYCSMQDEDDNWSLFVFDDSKGIWHKEDDLHAIGFCNYSDELFAVQPDKLISLGGIYGDKEDDFDWMLQTGNMGYRSPLRKTINRLVERLKLPITSRARIEIQYDDDGIWRPVSEIRPSGKIKSYFVPIKPFRCDHYSIRIKGKGEFDLQAITRHWAEGSEKD